MKRRRKEAPPPAAGETGARGPRRWVWAAAACAVFLAALVLYEPCLRGPFLFDDNYLPFELPNHPAALRYWMGVRPLLMFSYWLNFRLSGAGDSFAYHAVNLVLHSVNTLLIFFLTRRFLDLARAGLPARDRVAALAAALFLVHPVQSEAVAYVAGRSECLSVMFVLGALTVFLYRPKLAVGWGTAAAVLALFCAALASKEHAVALLPLLLVTDYFWNPGFSLAGIRRNWRLYAPVALGAGAGVVYLWEAITRAGSAGFGMKDFTWYQYFFTQCRAFFVYLRLFVLPVNQALDYDVAISHTILEHGAIFGLAVILVLVAAAWRYRRRFPLAAYGLFAYLVLMAPTSSFLPIRDPIAERRMYLPMIGLLLIVAEGLRHVRLERLKTVAVLAAVLVAASVATYGRSRMWADPVALWADNARVFPNRFRVRFQAAHAYYAAGRCVEAAREYEQAAKLAPESYDVLLDWALACECAGQTEEALEKLQRAAQYDSGAHVHTQIAMVYAKRARWPEALDALAKAELMNPGFALTYVYRGDVKRAMGDPEGAITEYRKALALEPNNEQAREGLAQAGAQKRGQTHF